MRAFLFAHIHWLWSILHWLRCSVFDWSTFIVVSFIALAQTLVAWDSGYLAVIGVGEHVSKRRHYWIFGTLCVALLLLTLAVGVLNDRSQHSSELRADDAKRQRDDLQKKLNQSLVAIAEAKSGVEALIIKQDTAPKCDTRSGEIVEGLKAISRRLSQAATQAENPVVPINTQASIPAQPSPQFPVPTPYEKLRQIHDRIHDLDFQWQNGTRLEVTQFIAPRKLGYDGGIPAELPDYLVSKLIESNKGATSIYSGLRPDLLKARHDVLAQITMTPTEAEKDDGEFREADNKARTPTPASKLKEISPDTTQFRAIDDYLENLLHPRPIAPR
jgi:hypothetical protein